MYKEGIYLGCRYKVNEQGDCFVENSQGELVHRNWRYNHDGYCVVSATGYNSHGGKIYQTLQVHILVAHQFVDGWFEGAEVNHKDFNRANPNADNLEWVTHADNVKYSHKAGNYKGKYGKDNPNYGNSKLHERYEADKNLAKEKQSRPGGQNGRARKCRLISKIFGLSYEFNCQREAVIWLFDNFYMPVCSKEHIIKQLKCPEGYKDWYLIQI